jgi:probable HAF family extracellular repeat protein
MRNNKRCWWVAGTRLIITLALQMVVGVAFGQTAESSSYTFVVVDTPAPDGRLGFTSLTDITDKGKVLVGFTAGPHSLLLNRFEATPIECPNVVQGTGAWSMNKRGEIAGFCGLHGFRRRNNGEYTLLDVPGANLTRARGINDDGDVVGGYRDSITGRYHGFHWEETDGLFSTIDVPFPDATTTIELLRVNNAGQMVGTYLNGSVPAHDHGFLYDNGVFTSIDVPDAEGTIPAGINDQGQIVGFYTDTLGSHHGFLLDNGTFTTIDAPFPGVILTDAYGINNQGQVVGRFITNGSGDHGFVATPHQSSTVVTDSLSQPRVKK